MSTLQHEKKSKKKEKTDTRNGHITKNSTARTMCTKNKRNVNDFRAHKHHNAQGQNTCRNMQENKITKWATKITIRATTKKTQPAISASRNNLF